MKVTVKLSEWYARGNVSDDRYFPYLLQNNQRCCLGFACAAYGVPDRELLSERVPEDVSRMMGPNWMLFKMANSELAYLAMSMNDGGFEYDDNDEEEYNWSRQPLEVRMGNLISVFAEGGDELEFVP